MAPTRDGEERLIDAGTLHRAASTAGRAERYGRGITPHTIHVWWARRPFSAMRALVFAALARGSGAEAQELLDKLAAAPIPDPETSELARRHLGRWPGAPSPPRVLDLFGGGGTIGLEAARLGARTSVVELNELSVFLQRCLLVRSREVEPGRVAPLLRESGERVLRRLVEATEPYFPLRHRPLGGDPEARATTYLWTYSAACPGCGERFSLMRRPWLSRRRGRRVCVADLSDPTNPSDPSGSPDRESRRKVKGARCPSCGREQTPDIRRCRDELVALVVGRRGSGKAFIDPPPEAVPAPEALDEAERELLGGLELPRTRLPRWSGVINPPLYGLETHADLLNRRQRLVMLHLIRELLDEHRRLEACEGTEAARLVIGLLSGLVDQALDWNGRLSMWISQNEQIGRGFCGPGLAMLWDTAELDPAWRGPANLWDKLDRIVRGAEAIGDLPGETEVIRGSACALPFDDESFEAVVTDPPYYDNLCYSALADCFYAWKRPLIQRIEPDLAGGELTTSEGELVASSFRAGDPVMAHERYCAELARALNEAARVLRSDGVMALIYSHGALSGWEALTRALRETPLIVTGVQPLGIERRQRPRAVRSGAVNTCLVFVLRKELGISGRSHRDVADLARELAELRDGPLPRELLEAGWPEEDVALAVFAQAVGLAANAPFDLRSEDIAGVLAALEQVVRERFGRFELARRRSL